MVGYDELRQILLREVSSPSLSEIPPAFFEDLQSTIDKIDEKVQQVGQRQPERSLLLGEKQKLLDLTKLLIQERCRKIVLHACTSSVPPTREGPDWELFQEVSRSIEKYMERFYRFLEPRKQERSTEEASSESLGEISTRLPPFRPAPELGALSIIRDVPRFVGTDMKVYGPFTVEDVVVLPGDVSGVLVRRRAAKPIDPGYPGSG